LSFERIPISLSFCVYRIILSLSGPWASECSFGSNIILASLRSCKFQIAYSCFKLDALASGCSVDVQVSPPFLCNDDATALKRPHCSKIIRILCLHAVENTTCSDDLYGKPADYWLLTARLPRFRFSKTNHRMRQQFPPTKCKCHIPRSHYCLFHMHILENHLTYGCRHCQYSAVCVR
jgi:hypothetical protein